MSAGRLGIVLYHLGEHTIHSLGRAWGPFGQGSGACDSCVVCQAEG